MTSGEQGRGSAADQAASGCAQVIVIGGGAAGMIAAMRAAECGATVTLLEKNERLGTKILISGGGKCNVTHAGSMETLRAAFRPNEALFLKPAFYRYTNDDFIQLLHSTGMPTLPRDDGRVFPREPGNAKDVVAALESIVRKRGVRIRAGTPISALSRDEKRGLILRTSSGETLRADHVVIAVGGSSYPATGTTGDGWRWAEALGHSIAPLRAALAPIYLTDARPDWSGVSLRDVTLRAKTSPQGKVYARWRGDVLFTHKGISGPCALGISRDVVEYANQTNDRTGGALEIDASPDSSFESVVAALSSQGRASPRTTLRSWVGSAGIPNRLIDTLLERAVIDPDVRIGQLPQKAVTAIIRQVKEFDLGTVRAVPLERGEVVAGGIRLDEVEPKTMRSKLVPGLYLCGEVLDIAGPVGGYNLQAAWSTGHVAGETAARAALAPRGSDAPG